MKNKYSIVDELSSKHLEQLHELYKQMWWSKDRTREEIVTLLKNCIIVAAIDKESHDLVGFARVLTDELRYAFIFDVMTQENLRGKGLGKLVMQSILKHPKLQQVKYFELTCAPELTSYYEEFGFDADYKNVVPLRLQTT